MKFFDYYKYSKCLEIYSNYQFEERLLSKAIEIIADKENEEDPNKLFFSKKVNNNQNLGFFLIFISLFIFLFHSCISNVFYIK